MAFLHDFLHMVVLSLPCMLALGLLFGSLLNVVIYRSPRIVERQDWEEAAELCGSEKSWALAFGSAARPEHLAEVARGLDEALDRTPAPSLWHPPSACPKCSRPIRWYENIPVASWLWLRAKCAGCGLPIAARYPLVELAVMMIFGMLTYRLGPQVPLIGWAFFGASMVALGLIDHDTCLLPDRMTLGLLWVGLVVAAAGWTVPASLAITGAAVGYAVTVGLNFLCLVLLGKPAFAAGDAKMMAAIGAWMGHPELVLAALALAIVLGGAVAGVRILRKQGGGVMPFGPYLGIAGLSFALVGPEFIHAWIR